MMKLYKRVNNMPWNTFVKTAGAISGELQIGPNQERGCFRTTRVLDPYPNVDCALVPAPQAERHAALGRAVAEAAVKFEQRHVVQDLYRLLMDTSHGWRSTKTDPNGCDDCADFFESLADAIAAWMKAEDGHTTS